MVAAAKSYEGMFLVDNKFATKDWNDEEIQLSFATTNVVHSENCPEHKSHQEYKPFPGVSV